jgi:hypothetical protein
MRWRYLLVTWTGSIRFSELMSRRYEDESAVLKRNKGVREWRHLGQ